MLSLVAGFGDFCVDCRNITYFSLGKRPRNLAQIERQLFSICELTDK